LCHNRIFCRAEKCFNFQVLFNPLKKQFDWSALFVDRRDGRNRQSEVVGDKLIHLAGFFILNCDQTHPGRMFFDETDPVKWMIRL